MDGETVVGIFDRDRLSEALVTVHRHGYGANARVLDGARGDLPGQLRRAGFQTELAVDGSPAETAMVLVYAPQRSAPVRKALEGAGARQVVVLSGGAPMLSWTPRAAAARPRTATKTTAQAAPLPEPAPTTWSTHGADAVDTAGG